jgi:predicted metal-dependent enzyme (double-stranded beta helix superfamily)
MFDVEGLVEDLRRAMRETMAQQAVREVVARAIAHPYEEIERALGAADRAELKGIHRSADLTVLKIVWSPGMQIYPHDHRMWAVIGVYGGAEDNAFFRRRPPGLERASEKTLERGDVATLGLDVIHAVKNPRTTPTAAIHVYGGDFVTTPRSEWTPETFEERPSSGERTRAFFLEQGGVVSWADVPARHA